MTKLRQRARAARTLAILHPLYPLFFDPPLLPFVYHLYTVQTRIPRPTLFPYVNLSQRAPYNPPFSIAFSDMSVFCFVFRTDLPYTSIFFPAICQALSSFDVLYTFQTLFDDLFLLYLPARRVSFFSFIPGRYILTFQKVLSKDNNIVIDDSPMSFSRV